MSLKQDNAEMLASIDEIDGGLIALTRFQSKENPFHIVMQQPA